METSRADTGSSQTMSDGSPARARAMADALTLPARELVGIAPGEVAVQTHHLEELGDAVLVLGLALAPAGASCSGSPTMLPMLWRGSREPKGSWKTIVHPPAERADLSLGQSRDVLALEDDVCRAVGSYRRTMQRPTVVLPHPLSPTSPSVSPLRMAKLTPSTALTSATLRRNSPAVTGKYILRSRTSSSVLVGRRALLACVSDPLETRWQAT